MLKPDSISLNTSLLMVRTELILLFSTSFNIVNMKFILIKENHIICSCYRNKTDLVDWFYLSFKWPEIWPFEEFRKTYRRCRKQPCAANSTLAIYKVEKNAILVHELATREQIGHEVAKTQFRGTKLPCASKLVTPWRIPLTCWRGKPFPLLKCSEFCK